VRRHWTKGLVNRHSTSLHAGLQRVALRTLSQKFCSRQLGMLGYEGQATHWSSRKTLTRWWNSGMAARLASDRRCVSAAMRRPSAISLRTSANASPSPASLPSRSACQYSSHEPSAGD